MEPILEKGVVARRKRRVFLAATLLLFASSPLGGQTNPVASEQTDRQKALALFAEGRRLEALPLLEDAAKKEPKDAEVLVVLAASLVEHAATLNDPDAAAKERFRARDLVQKGWELGDTSPLAENLRQLLAELPTSGAIKFSDNPAVEQAMDAGEAAFARRDFNEALRDYAKALEIEPTNYAAALFTGNTYDKNNQVAEAAEWYERAIQIDPNVETAYRYYAVMAAKHREMAKARSLLIQAAVAEPYSKIVWREIRAWAIINHTAFNIVYAPIPLVRQADDTQAAGLSSAWRAYYSEKAEWPTGGKFAREFPQEAGYRHSLPEETEALTAACHALEKLKQDEKAAELVASDSVAGLLLRLYDAGLIEAYVLFSLGDDEIAKDYKAYRAKNRDKLEAYMDKFVMPPTSARQ